MTTLNQRIANRFYRTSPMYSDDRMVGVAINKVESIKEIQTKSEQVEDLVKVGQINQSHINYVKKKLLENFTYSNNEKLLMNNRAIFNALIIDSMKGGELDIEDLDYIHNNIKTSASDYTKELIKFYFKEVTAAKGKVVKDEEEKEEEKIKELKREKRRLEDSIKKKDEELDQLNMRNGDLQNDLENAQNLLEKCTNQLDETTLKFKELSKLNKELLANLSDADKLMNDIMKLKSLDSAKGLIREFLKKHQDNQSSK